MTHEELVEKVARELAKHDTHDPDKVSGDDPPMWRFYEVPARAVLSTIAEALKEPTAEMCLAGEMAPLGIGGSPPYWKHVYRAMLSAANDENDRLRALLAKAADCLCRAGSTMAEADVDASVGALREIEEALR